MNILAVDDERILLNELLHELQQVFPSANIHGTSDSTAAAEWVEHLAAAGEKLDYVFLDIRMKGMSGLELARRIKDSYPRSVLIFCTAYTEYAIDAFGLFAKGYLLKPITAEHIIQTLDDMVPDWRNALSAPTKNIRVQTFGHFEVFVDERPLVFEREKARELLAYLIDRHGSSVTTEQIATVLWEDRPYDRTMKNYVSTVLGSLRSTLRAVGADSILNKTRNHLSVDVTKLKCDAYDFENQDPVAISAFKGEYMVNYSWAEFTTGNYVQVKKSLQTK